jgi:hypothetical protein
LRLSLQWAFAPRFIISPNRALQAPKSANRRYTHYDAGSRELTR